MYLYSSGVYSLRTYNKLKETKVQPGTAGPAWVQLSFFPFPVGHPISAGCSCCCRSCWGGLKGNQHRWSSERILRRYFDRIYVQTTIEATENERERCFATNKVRTDTTILVRRTRYRDKLGGSFDLSRYTLPIRPRLGPIQEFWFAGPDTEPNWVVRLVRHYTLCTS